jgi:hypothetical protein
MHVANGIHIVQLHAQVLNGLVKNNKKRDLKMFSLLVLPTKRKKIK